MCKSGKLYQLSSFSLSLFLLVFILGMVQPVSAQPLSPLQSLEQKKPEKIQPIKNLPDFPELPKAQSTSSKNLKLEMAQQLEDWAKFWETMVKPYLKLVTTSWIEIQNLSTEREKDWNDAFDAVCAERDGYKLQYTLLVDKYKNVDTEKAAWAGGGFAAGFAVGWGTKTLIKYKGPGNPGPLILEWDIILEILLFY
jgi:hypothetical protein